MSDITLPARLEGVEPVRAIRTPAGIHYRYTAGEAASKFLREVAKKRLVGQRCPACQKVYVPPRSACPVDGVPTVEEIELGDIGTVTTLSLIHI